MKESLSALEHFISDFNLRQPNGVIAFIATIHFDQEGQTQVDESEVHIITSDNIGAIYFLSLDGKVPDMFSVKEHEFNYVEGSNLNIRSGGYNVAVFPKKQKAQQR
jgi:hypothetical protein